MNIFLVVFRIYHPLLIWVGETIAFKSAQRTAKPSDGANCCLLRVTGRVMTKSMASLGMLLLPLNMEDFGEQASSHQT